MTKKDIKLLVYLEDNNQPKDRKVIILKKDDFGVTVQPYDDINNKEIGPSFFIPWHMVLKIKDILNEEKK